LTERDENRTQGDISRLAAEMRARGCDGKKLIHWAQRYNGYERLGAGPSELVKVLSPLQNQIESSRRIPEWAGVDLLRGLAFWRVRVAAHREAPDDALDDDVFLAAAEALLEHPHARPSDRPPL
jgi:hypothetical protein